MNIVPCKDIGCERKILARGMCSTHYSYWHRASKGRNDAVYVKDCAFCSTEFKTLRKTTKYCTLICAQRHISGWSTSREITKARKPRQWFGQVIKPRNGGAMVAGRCAYCPTYFVGPPNARYCSEKCSNNASFKRKYDRRGQFSPTLTERLAIYKRDKHECQICGDPVDMGAHWNEDLAPSLDHIIPQSHMLIPDHSPKNLRLAHRLCNAIRGDRVELAA